MLTSASAYGLLDGDDVEHTYKHPSHGLTTEKASSELAACIKELIETEKKFRFSFKKALFKNGLNEQYIVIILTIALLCIAFGLRVGADGFSASHLIFEAAFLLVLLVVNVFLDLREKYRIHFEIMDRAAAHLEYFEKHNDSVQVTGIHEPLMTVTHSTVLRDGKWRDIPSTFLAKGDLVGLSEGAVAPSRMDCVEPGLEGVRLEEGQVYTMEKLQLRSKGSADKIPELDPSSQAAPEVEQSTSLPVPTLHDSRSQQQERCCFVVVDPPIISHLTQAFQPPVRPTDPICYAVAFALKILTRILYFLLAVSIVSIAFRAGFQDREDLVDLIIVRQTVIVLAMATVLCSKPMLHIVYAIANGRLLALFDLLQDRSAKGDFSPSLEHFDAEDQLRVVSTVPKSLFWKYFKILLLGNHPGMLASVNLVNTLGSTTVFCCADKEGVLSEPVWPVQEINILQENIVSLELSPEYVKGIPTVHFNDQEWRAYMGVLKPLGLNCLLNRTCRDPAPTIHPVDCENPHNNTHQHNALIHSQSNIDSAKLRFIRARERAHGVASQCVCLLGKEIGFADDAFDQFVRVKELHTIAPPNGGQDVDHSPYMISLVAKDNNSGTLQLLSKGSPDLILANCSTYWDGESLRVFGSEERRKVMDLYNKIIDKGGHGIAFAYKSIKPIFNKLFEEANVNSPIVDVRMHPPQHVFSPASSHIVTDADSPFVTSKAAHGILGEDSPAPHTSPSPTPVQARAREEGIETDGKGEGGGENGEWNDDEEDFGKRGTTTASSPDYLRRSNRGRTEESEGDGSGLKNDSTLSESPQHSHPALSERRGSRFEKRKGRNEEGVDEGEALGRGSVRGRKKSQAALRFSSDDSDKGERKERGDDGRRSRRRRMGQRKAEPQLEDEDEIEEDDGERIRKSSSGDVKKKPVHSGRKKKRRGDGPEDSSSEKSEEEKGKKRSARHRKRTVRGSSSSSDDTDEERNKKKRSNRDDGRPRRSRPKKQEDNNDSDNDDSQTSSSSTDEDRKRRKPRKKESSREILRKKKESKKKPEPRSPRKGKGEEDSAGEKRKKRVSIDAQEKVINEDEIVVSATPRKESSSGTITHLNNDNSNSSISNTTATNENISSKPMVDRKKSVQELKYSKEITEDDVSRSEGMESDAGGEVVTLEKLQAEQIFIGMISMREIPKLHTNNFVEVLREAGVRFVLFSSEPRRSLNHFVHKLGLETDWNCCVSLRDPGPNEPHVQDEPSKLPRGISSVRAHLEVVDNVPLLVPLFCDSGPAETQEMIKILQENGEVVCCVGSALNCRNMETFCQANVSFALEPLLRRCLNQDRDSSDSRPLLTSRNFFENQSSRKVPFSTRSLSSDMNALPCSLVYHRYTDWNEILELLQLSRQMLTNVRHSLLYYAAGCVWLAFVILLGAVFGLSLSHNETHTVAGVPLTGLQVIWMICIILPLFSLSLMTCPADPDIMHMLNGKNLPQYRLRGISKFSWYMAIRMAPSIILTTILFLWAVEVIWTAASWGNVFGTNLDDVPSVENYGKALMVAQNILMFASVYYLALTSASFHSHTTSIINFNPLKNVVWFICTLLGLGLQIMFFTVSLAFSRSFEAMSRLPWYFYVVLFVWAGGLLLIDELMKRMYRKWFKRFQLELRLEFDTKLGMHSPI